METVDNFGCRGAIQPIVDDLQASARVASEEPDQEDVFAGMFPRHQACHGTSYPVFKQQAEKVREETTELLKAVEQEGPLRWAEEAADVMQAAAQLLHMLAPVTRESPEEALRVVVAKNKARGYYGGVCACDRDWVGPHQQGCPMYDENDRRWQEDLDQFRVPGAEAL